MQLAAFGLHIISGAIFVRKAFVGFDVLGGAGLFLPPAVRHCH
jgi:hypothetical protein